VLVAHQDVRIGLGLTGRFGSGARAGAVVCHAGAGARVWWFFVVGFLVRPDVRERRHRPEAGRGRRSSAARLTIGAVKILAVPWLPLRFGLESASRQNPSAQHVGCPGSFPQ
jgi:hypothetical protein